MTDISILDCRPTPNTERVPINIDPDVLTRLRLLLWTRQMHGVGYSAFINRACEIAETEIAEKITRENEMRARIAKRHEEEQILYARLRS